MKTAIKTNSTSYPKFVDLADFEEELENKYLDSQVPKSVSVPQGGFDRPTVPESKSESRAIPLPEAVIFLFLSFTGGFWLGITHANNVINQVKTNLLIEQVSGYLFWGLLPCGWGLITYLYIKSKKR